MSTQPTEKTQALVEALAAARQETLALLEDADLSTVAHPDSGWTVQDIINHLAWSDEWAAGIIKNALLNILFDTPKHWLQRNTNDLIREERRSLSVEQSLADFAEAHEDFKATIQRLNAGQLTTEFMAPWRQMITPRYLVKIMVEHEEEHREEIRQAVIS